MSVNEKKRGRPPEGDGKLSAEAIIAAAREQMLQKGQKLSIRGLARQLNVDPMAIYYYFDNKNALLEAVAVNIMAGIYMPDGSGEWETELEKLCVSYITLLRDHPGLLETLLNMTGSGLGHGEVFRARFEIVVSNLNIDAEARHAALDLLVDYLHGFALAMQTSTGENSVDISGMKEPLKLYKQALSHAVST